MKIKYLSHSAVLIESKKYKFLIDPFLKGNPTYKPDATDIEGITHIFVTHGHGDHVGDTLEIAKANNAMIISNAEIGTLFWHMDKSLSLHPMHIGGTYEFPFGRVKMTNAIHGSSMETKDGIVYAGNPGGFLITIEGKTIYHAGDTALTYDMKLLEKEHIDVAFLPIGGNYTMDIEDAVLAVDFIKPKIAVPMHYKTFAAINAEPREFVRALPKGKGQILEFGEYMII